MATADNGDQTELGVDYLKLATDLVTLTGAIISTWYFIEFVTHDALSTRCKTEWHRLRAKWRNASRRRQFRDTPPELLLWEAENALRGP